MDKYNPLALPSNNQAIAPLDVGSLADAFIKSGFFKDTQQQAQAIVKIMLGNELLYGCSFTGC